MKIHFGAFNCPVDGWVNTDITPHLFIARVPLLPRLLHTAGKMTLARWQEHGNGTFRRLHYLNVGKPWPYADGSVEAVFSSHVLEHLPLHAAKACLKSACRVLKTGGVVRIVVPDLDRQIAIYKPESAYEWAENFFEASCAAEKNMHHFMYNEHSMAQLMRDAGFTAISRCAYRVGRCPDIDLLDNRPDSLFMEAVR